MSPTAAFRTQFFSWIVLAIFFGVWLQWAFEQAQDGNLAIVVWVTGIVIFAGAVAFDAFTIMRRLVGWRGYRRVPVSMTRYFAWLSFYGVCVIFVFFVAGDFLVFSRVPDAEPTSPVPAAAPHACRSGKRRYRNTSVTNGGTAGTTVGTGSAAADAVERVSAI